MDARVEDKAPKAFLYIGANIKPTSIAMIKIIIGQIKLSPREEAPEIRKRNPTGSRAIIRLAKRRRFN